MVGQITVNCKLIFQATFRAFWLSEMMKVINNQYTVVLKKFVN